MHGIVPLNCLREDVQTLVRITFYLGLFKFRREQIYSTSESVAILIWLKGCLLVQGASLGFYVVVGKWNPHPKLELVA